MNYSTNSLLMHTIRDPILEELIKHNPQTTAEIRTVIDNYFLGMVNSSSLPDIGDYIEDVKFSQVGEEILLLDIYKPAGNGPFPILVYLHGGGFIMGNSKTYRHIGCRLADAGYLVFSVNYRLAPEFSFPAAFEDCCTAMEWLLANAQNYGGDFSRLAVAGDSAGGNLAAGVAVKFSDSELVNVSALVLIYAVLQPPDMADYERHGPIPKMLLDAYVGSNDFRSMVKDWRYNPLLKSEVMPPTCLVCGTADPLLADARTMAEKLGSSGIECKEAYFDDMPHGFIQMDSIFAEANEAINNIIGFLNRKV